METREAKYVPCFSGLIKPHSGVVSRLSEEQSLLMLSGIKRALHNFEKRAATGSRRNLAPRFAVPCPNKGTRVGGIYSGRHTGLDPSAIALCEGANLFPEPPEPTVKSPRRVLLKEENLHSITPLPLQPY